jgi:uncharacterized protein YciI
VELDEYQLVLLRRPSNAPTMSDEEADRLQQAHLDYLDRLRADGHIRFAGPVRDQPDESLRGLTLFHVGSLERARELAGADPAVVAGRLAVEVMRFFCRRGELDPAGPLSG